MPTKSFDLQPGERIRRKDLHLKYGGIPQGGMSPSRISPNIFLFTDAEAGPQHGYRDGWNEDGLFHYTGMGQHGNQRMIMGNRALLNHKRERRAVRLFQGSRGVVTYVGEFELDSEQPYYKKRAPSTGNGPLRTVFVFRLRPLGSPVRRTAAPSVKPRQGRDRFADAFAYANSAHRGQKRKGTKIPCVSHVLAVASIVLNHGGDEEEAIAALLHDVPEDCGGRPRLDEIRRQFGDRVAEVVEGCSDSLVIDPLTKEPWQQRRALPRPRAANTRFFRTLGQCSR
jgi:hypothetical protein